MDNNEDKYIKDIFQKDDLISKNADDIFNRFLSGDIPVEDEDVQTDEKVVNINEARERKNNSSRKKMFSAVASIAVIFVAANTYASTQGYGNIFFMIRDIINNSDIVIENKEEILSDRDITISYESIDIVDDLKIQINNLVIEENKAILKVQFDECSNTNIKERAYSYKVYDITGNEKNLLADAKTSVATDNIISQYPGARFSEDIELKDFKNSTQILLFEIYNEKGESLISLEIDIENKQIDIISKKEVVFEKISEVELKEILSKYVFINCYNDKSTMGYNSGTKKQELNRALLGIVIDSIYNKEWEENKNVKLESACKSDKINVALEELTGDKYTEALDLHESSYIYVDKETGDYNISIGDEPLTLGLCLDVSDISYKNGVYTVTCVYCFPGEGDYLDGTISELEQYKTTFELKLNEEYSYLKYQIVNLEALSSIKVKDSEKVSSDITNNTVTNITENILIKDDNVVNSVSNTTNTTVANTVSVIPNNNNSNSVEYVYGREYEKELVDFLKNIVRVNFYTDLKCATSFTEAEYQNEMKVLAALELSGKDTLTRSEQAQIQKEITGDSAENFTMSHIAVGDYGTYFGYISKDYGARPVLYRIVCIKEQNDTYTAKVIYKHRKTDTELFIVNVEYKENTNYKYSKYQCTNMSTLKSTSYVINDDNLDNDTFAYSLPWVTLGMCRLSLSHPKHFNVFVGDTTYNGDETPGTFAGGMKGVVHGYTVNGINKEDAEMIVNTHVPELLTSSDLKAYAKTVADRYNVSYASNTFENAVIYSNDGNERWIEIKAEEKEDYAHNYYCLIRKNNDGKLLGYVVEVEITKPNERTQNYLYV